MESYTHIYFPFSFNVLYSHHKAIRKLQLYATCTTSRLYMHRLNETVEKHIHLWNFIKINAKQWLYLFCFSWTIEQYVHDNKRAYLMGEERIRLPQNSTIFKFLLYHILYIYTLCPKNKRNGYKNKANNLILHFVTIDKKFACSTNTSDDYF